MDGAFGNLMIISKTIANTPTLHGVIRIDGKQILPMGYEFLKLTPCKQILAKKNSTSPYILFNDNGQIIYEFKSDFNGELLYDGIGNYMFVSSDTMLSIISSSGAKVSNIKIAENSYFSFVNGLIQIIEPNGECKYYNVTGNRSAL